MCDSVHAGETHLERVLDLEDLACGDRLLERGVDAGGSHLGQRRLDGRAGDALARPGGAELVDDLRVCECVRGVMRGIVSNHSVVACRATRTACQASACEQCFQCLSMYSFRSFDCSNGYAYETWLGGVRTGG